MTVLSLQTNLNFLCRRVLFMECGVGVLRNICTFYLLFVDDIVLQSCEPKNMFK